MHPSRAFCFLLLSVVSRQATAVSLRDYPSEAPQSQSSGIHFDWVTSHAVSLRWTQIEDEIYPVMAYQIIYENLDPPTSSHASGRLTVNHNPGKKEATATVDNLTYNTRYMFMVSIITEKGETPIHPSVTVKTRCQDPVVPDNVLFLPSMSETREAAIFVSYRPMSETNSGCDAITDVWLDYKLADDVTWKRERIPVSATDYTALPPEGAGKYHVMIVVQNNEGFVDSTGIISIKIKGLPTTDSQPSGKEMNIVVYWTIIGALSVTVIGVVVSFSVGIFVHTKGKRKCQEPVGTQTISVLERNQSQFSVGHYQTIRIHRSISGRTYLDPSYYLEPCDYLIPRDYITLIPDPSSAVTDCAQETMANVQSDTCDKRDEAPKSIGSSAYDNTHTVN